MENFEILEEKENPLFNRKEIHLKLESNSAPSREEIRKAISEKFSSPTANIRVNKVLGNFGSKTFNIEARIYTSKEDKENTELKSGRSTKDDIKNAEKPAEETPVETPTEQTPESKPEEQTPAEAKPEEQTPVEESPKEEIKKEEATE